MELDGGYSGGKIKIFFIDFHNFFKGLEPQEARSNAFYTNQKTWNKTSFILILLYSSFFKLRYSSLFLLVIPTKILSVLNIDLVNKFLSISNF